MVKHTELIIDYIYVVDSFHGDDLVYNDNTGIIVRCKDCIHHKNRLCKHFSRHGTIETGDRDYCSYGEKKNGE